MAADCDIAGSTSSVMSKDARRLAEGKASSISGRGDVGSTTRKPSGIALQSLVSLLERKLRILRRTAGRFLAGLDSSVFSPKDGIGIRARAMVPVMFCPVALDSVDDGVPDFSMSNLTLESTSSILRLTVSGRLSEVYHTIIGRDCQLCQSPV